jgi:hypothetical protein
MRENSVEGCTIKETKNAHKEEIMQRDETVQMQTKSI